MAIGDGSSFAALSRASRRGAIDPEKGAASRQGAHQVDTTDEASIAGAALEASQQLDDAVHELESAPSKTGSPFDKLARQRAPGRDAGSTQQSQAAAAEVGEKLEVDSIFRKLAHPPGEVQVEEVAPARSYESASASGTPPSAFGRLVKPEARPTASLARRDMNAAKVLTRLVMAIVRKPGSGVPDGVKSKALAGLLRETRGAAERLVSSIAPLDANKGWIMAAAQEAAATMVASRWESDPSTEPQPIIEHIEVLESVFHLAEEDAGLRATLDDLGASRYVESTDPTIASARVELSARMAFWDLLGWVNHPSLGAGIERYTYDRPATQIVEMLAPDLVSIAREGNIRIDSLDLRTTHMQSSLRRLADLMGAEYVARTRQLMNWIAEEGISDDVHQDRRAEAKAQFETRVLPDLVDWTRRNFMAVESMAARYSEDIDDRSDRQTPRQ